MGKVKELYDLSHSLNEIRCNKKVVLCHGTFDPLHIGHIKHFQAAKSQGDILVVTITPDKYVKKGPNRPLFDENLRAETIESLECVDYVVINYWPSAIETINVLKPDIYAKGADYRDRKSEPKQRFPLEKAAVESFGGRVYFKDEIRSSSTELLNKFISETDKLPKNTREYLKSFRYSYDDIIEWIEKIKDISVLVVSEIIIDEYQYGESIGKSGKSPVVAFKIGKNERYEGGALVIKKHLQDFVRNVDIVDSNIIIKKRYVEGNQKLFETYNIDENHPNICEDVKNRICGYDLVLVADFGHGLLTKELRDIIKQKAKFLAVTTQRNAGNMGHNTIRKYWDRKNNIYICIDEDELRLAVHEKYNRDHSLDDIIKNELVATSIITSGPNGCIVSGAAIPALTTYAIDPVGAGDAFLSITAPLVCVGAPMDLVGFVGCVAGAIKVSYAGNKEHISKESLYNYIEKLLR